MNTFNLTNHDGKYYADSREVAEKIERPHKEMLVLQRSTYDECIFDFECSFIEY